MFGFLDFLNSNIDFTFDFSVDCDLLLVILIFISNLLPIFTLDFSLPSSFNPISYWYFNRLHIFPDFDSLVYIVLLNFFLELIVTWIFGIQFYFYQSFYIELDKHQHRVLEHDSGLIIFESFVLRLRCLLWSSSR